MSNQIRPKPAPKALLNLGGLSLVLFLVLAASCSIVFRSSIQGTVIDKEDWADGTTTGVADAKVFLYTDEKDRDGDLALYADGDEATLPDGLAEQKYFQSTVTDADGGYDFTGFIWEKLFSEYGKTADRAEVHLLIYHPDYGLWKNPVPLYVVSDVTNQLPQITIEDLWNQGRLAGTVLDWNDTDGVQGLTGVTINIYVAKTWSYDTSGNPVEGVFPNTISATATTDADGRWNADVNFRKMAGSDGIDKGKAPVRVSYALANYRANDNDPAPTTLANADLVTDVDLDRDGAIAAAGDYEDVFRLATAEYDTVEKAVILKTVASLTMQRWRFSATVSGRTIDFTDVTEPIAGVNGVTVNLSVGGRTYTADSAPVDTASSTEDGRFDLGTITWIISDISVPADQKTGEVPVTMTATGVATLNSGALTTLKPDIQRSLTLKVTP